ncbi:virulence RhuM family protein [Prevotella salivae]|jgi:death-on-curing family protein|uniref:virulence protein RhuM/Fic/DOC family protein n=1 Tax=Segatella salivae TaxID=228604 RepID=UPI001C5EE58C|nr:virulence protein RhuM/Fic/DOC family protein [Segatella salivae]MBW4763433.1 virulence RhuM family protein [Segatella salivae]
MDSKGEIKIYQLQDGQTTIDVRLENETVWLNRNQIATLFDRDVKTIGKHINNALKEELEGEVVVAKFATTTQHGALEGKTQTHMTDYYNLEMITSVGYRVKSKRGVEFRRWANTVLKEYLVKGYAVKNDLDRQRYDDLRHVVEVMGRTIKSLDAKVFDETEKAADNADEREVLINVITDYTQALDTLDDYDYQRLEVSDTNEQERFHATYDNAMEAIQGLKEKFGASRWFANEKDDSFKSSIGQIYQTFGGVELYPSVEEKAAMLLYLVTKNHSFSDGNKRIAATLFLWFMNNNGILYNPDGSKRIGDNTLVALTLMIAESRTEEKDTMVKVVVNLINKKNV